MEAVTQFFHHLRSLDELIRWGGLVVLVAIVFAETGLLIGFFLPGDSLLIAAGLFAAKGDYSTGWLLGALVSITVAAIVGNAVGYWIGHKAGPRLFSRPDSRLFKRKHLEKTQEFYAKHGGKAIVLARFVPIVRTFVPVVAGVAGMPFRRFMLYNFWGGVGWVFSMCLTGYFLGGLVPGIDQHLEKLILVVIVLSVLPVVWHAYKERAHSRRVTIVPGEVPRGMNPEFRGLRASERDAVLDLWGEVFRDDSRTYFVHYFDADPEYLDEDCRVAVVDGRLVSAVHICRRRLEWQGQELLCGAIANVATRAEYRRRGISRELLRQAVARMEAEGFAFSMLFTGSHDHYRPLGWQEATIPWLSVTISSTDLPTRSPVHELSLDPVPDVVKALYDDAPRRPLHLARPARYFESWTGWFWRGSQRATILLIGSEQPRGYAVLTQTDEGTAAVLQELRAMDREAEAMLLGAAAHRALQGGASDLELRFIPGHGGEEAAGRIGVVRRQRHSDMMLRPISVSSDEMACIASAYETGTAVFWDGDSF